MTWIEIINARMTGVSEPLELTRLLGDIQAHVDARAGRMVRLAFFKNGLVENDWSIHLFWKTRAKPSGKTELGNKLAEIIRPFAMVDHAVWIEERLNGLKDPVRELNRSGNLRGYLFKDS